MMFAGGEGTSSAAPAAKRQQISAARQAPVKMLRAALFVSAIGSVHGGAVELTSASFKV